MYHHTPNQQVVVQRMAMQGQPGTQSIGPQIPTSDMQQPVPQSNPVHESDKVCVYGAIQKVYYSKNKYLFPLSPCHTF